MQGSMVSAVLLLLCLPCSSQQPSPPAQQEALLRLDTQVKAQRDQLQRLSRELQALKAKQLDQSARLNSETGRLDRELLALGFNTKSTTERLGGLESKTTQRVLMLALALGAFALGGLGMFLLLRKKTRGLDVRIKEAREVLNQETVQLDEKLVDLLTNQLRMMANPPAPPAPAPPGKEDHSFALRVGEEIYRMRQRVSSMPDETKGLKPLRKSLERLEEDFNRRGYELVDLLNKPFTEEMVVKARFIPSDDLSVGERVITRVIKPPILYGGVALELPEVEVSTGG